ncbi:substrate-binding domain-containing protein [Qiania dongpingensis]|uniref:Substrate-binding domain-containing protein n=1 Tax=Qiania dongpingensis TaxID=2763669 RepID=A0A7G9G3P7_9FIRM|nr:substrate-binding domain-containing protein [Qiania dongpingensis]QNM05429.1 substrate-binding domain-containing protein [Qiania dongpingensis]
MKRKRMVSLGLAVMLAVCMIISLAGCGKKEDTSATAETSGTEAKESTDSGKETKKGTETSADKGEKKTIYFMPKEVAGAWNVYSCTGAEEAGEKLGIDVIISGPANADPTEQINMLEDAIVAKPDAIVIATNDAAGCKASIDKAVSQGILVLTYDSDCADSERTFYVNSASDYECGRMFVKDVAEAVGKDAKVAVMGGGISAGNQQERLAGVQDEMAENYPDMELVSTTWSDDDTEVALQNAENLIMANPDLQAIIGISGYEPHSAAAAVEEAVEQGNLEKGSIFITGLTLPDVIRPYIEDGTVQSAYVTEPAYLAYTSVYAAYEMLEGKEFSDGDTFKVEGLEDVEATVTGEYIYFGLISLDKSNIGDYSW